jgi:hypothetical protein
VAGGQAVDVGEDAHIGAGSCAGVVPESGEAMSQTPQATENEKLLARAVLSLWEGISVQDADDFLYVAHNTAMLIAKGGPPPRAESVSDARRELEALKNEIDTQPSWEIDHVSYYIDARLARLPEK